MLLVELSKFVGFVEVFAALEDQPKIENLFIDKIPMIITHEICD